jgi:hypothetical protein
MPFDLGPCLDYVGRGQYVTDGPTTYVGRRDVITIPSHFQTDLASVPRIFWALLPPTGAYEKAALVHDYGCVELARGTCWASSRDVDGLFRRVMREEGVGLVTRWAMWAGVRWGALFNPARRPGVWRDLPLVLLITLLELAVVVAVLLGLHFLIDLAL